jgi:L-aspartate oxidase
MESRQALWRHGGIERDEAGLQILASDSHPLVRMIARCALARAESRGAHQRLDFPELDPALDDAHMVLDSSEQARAQRWA